MKNDINKDDFLGRWLSGNLSEEERKTFERSEDYLSYKDILNGVEKLERPTFDVEKGLAAQKKINASSKINKTSKIIKLRAWIYSAAAVILLVIGAKTLLFKETIVRTKMAETQILTLPDLSTVTLNADSSIKYDKGSFMEHRILQLKGEAYFNVYKGSSFTVNTQNGKVTVLGTAFNVYSRDEVLEVHCFEGKVSVKNEANEVILTPGKGTKSLKKERLSLFEISNGTPNWLMGQSNFNKVPLERLIKELERQYNIKINVGNIDVKRVFTGFFTHNNLETALRTSFEPMNISYTFEKDSSISLKNK